MKVLKFRVAYKTNWRKDRLQYKIFKKASQFHWNNHNEIKWFDSDNQKTERVNLNDTENVVSTGFDDLYDVQ